MASLYIKDPEANELAVQAAKLQGKTKTQAVKDSLRETLGKLQGAKPKRNFLEWVEQYHREHPLPPSTGLKADKAFYDSLNDEDDE